MRQLNETFEDDDYEFLLMIKGRRTWRNFILEMAHSEDLPTGKQHKFKPKK